MSLFKLFIQKLQIQTLVSVGVLCYCSNHKVKDVMAEENVNSTLHKIDALLVGLLVMIVILSLLFISWIVLIVFVCFFKKEEEKATRLSDSLVEVTISSKEKPKKVASSSGHRDSSMQPALLLKESGSKSEDIRDARVLPSTTPVKVLSAKKVGFEDEPVHVHFQNVPDKPIKSTTSEFHSVEAKWVGGEPSKSRIDYNPQSKIQHDSKCQGQESFGTVLSVCENSMSLPRTPSSSPANRNNSSGAGDASPKSQFVQLNPSVVDALQRLEYGSSARLFNSGDVKTASCFSPKNAMEDGLIPPASSTKHAPVEAKDMTIRAPNDLNSIDKSKVEDVPQIKIVSESEEDIDVFGNSSDEEPALDEEFHQGQLSGTDDPSFPENRHVSQFHTERRQVLCKVVKGAEPRFISSQRGKLIILYAGSRLYQQSVVDVLNEM
uniref:Uncharacterized protein n=1 Tax=Ditylenchus dipsaci TaxID=166011 RepID=A0A915D727_9BILA